MALSTLYKWLTASVVDVKMIECACERVSQSIEWEAKPMLEIASGYNLRVGVKQSFRAVNSGKAVKLYIARDAEPHVIRPIVEMATQRSVPIIYFDTMNELGKACKIDVGAATAVLMKQES